MKLEDGGQTIVIEPTDMSVALMLRLGAFFEQMDKNGVAITDRTIVIPYKNGSMWRCIGTNNRRGL